MKLIQKTALAACIAGTMIGTALPVEAADKKAVEQLFEQVKLEYEVFTLENGLTVLVYPDHKAPEVFVEVYYRVGSKDEPAGKSGFAHLYEHLMFNGTGNAPGDYFTYLNKIGASSMNGTTNPDRTNYYQIVPTGSLDAALWLESDRMANITTGVTQEVLDEQRGVVQNEKRQSAERGRYYDVFLKNFYPKGHPYDHSTIGSMEDLNSASLDDVHKWYEEYYGANNAIVVLAGDITVEQAKEKTAHYFSDVVPGRRLTKQEEYIPHFAENKEVVFYDKTPVTRVSRTWPLPSKSAKDFVLINHQASAIAGDKNSPLTKLLKDELNYVTEINMRAYGSEVNSTITLDYAIRPQANVTPEQVNAIIDKELTKYFKKGPDQDILDARSLNNDASLIRSMKKSTNLADYLAQSLMFHDDPEFFRKERAWEMGASTKTLKNVAKDWLSRPYLQITTLPEPNAKRLESVVDRSKMPEITEKIAKVEFPEFQEATLDNGLKLVVVEQKGIPMVDVIFEVETGKSADVHYGDDTSYRAFSLLKKGTKKYDESELAKKEKEIAVNFRTRSDQNTSTISFNTLTPYISDAFALASEVILKPSYPQKELDKEVEKVDSMYDGYEKNPARASQGLFQAALWGKDHDLGRITSRDNAKAALTRDNLMKFHKNEIGADNTTVYMMGDINLAQAKKVLSKHFGKWGKSNRAAAKEVAKPASSAGKVILIDTPHNPSASIIAGHLIGKYNADQYDTLSLANGPVGGYFESRINMNLREDKGWSYGARSNFRTNPYHQQSFSVSTQVQIDKLTDSIKEIQNEYNGYVGDKPATQAELDKVRDNRIKSYASRFTDDMSYLRSAMQSASYGLPYDHAEKGVDRMKAVSLEDAIASAKANIRPGDFVWVIAADLSKSEEQIRAMGLGEVEVWDVYANKIR